MPGGGQYTQELFIQTRAEMTVTKEHWNGVFMLLWQCTPQSLKAPGTGGQVDKCEVLDHFFRQDYTQYRIYREPNTSSPWWWSPVLPGLPRAPMWECGKLSTGPQCCQNRPDPKLLWSLSLHAWLFIISLSMKQQSCQLLSKSTTSHTHQAALSLHPEGNF